VKSRATRFPIRLMCEVLQIHPAGYYAWLHEPKSQRGKDDDYLSAFIKQFWLESGGVYGYRKIYDDLVAIGEQCGKNRVLRLMRIAEISSERGYKRRNHYPMGEPATIAPNLLNRDFNVDEPNQAWVTDITYVKTAEGWLFLAIVLDLFSRQVIGWAMSDRINTELVLDALVMACWRRRPKQKVIVHSDQGCQYTSYDWRKMLDQNGLIASMSRKGNCYDNAVAESFFQLLKRERIRRKVYPSREVARQDIFAYIEMFYNPVRRHGSNGNVSPAEYEKSYFKQLESV
jgi:putative transposase